MRVAFLPMKLPPRLVRFLAFFLALLPAWPALAADAPKKVLVVTVTTGFRHSCIPLSEKILEQLAKESGKFTVDFVRQPDGQPKAPAKPKPGKAGADDPAHQAALKKFAEDEKAYKLAVDAWTPKVEAALQKLSPANLKGYDAVLFASTTGDLPLPDKQGFLDWIASGKAFIGVHAATDTFHNFPPFIAMIGGEFRTHGPQVTVECLNQDPAHAACAPLPKTWTVFDEIYQLKNFERAKVHSLVSLDKLQLAADPKSVAPGDYPVAWSKAHGRGRVFYTSLGHREDMWDPTHTEKGERKNSPENAKLYQQHVLGGILWALGRAPGRATPERQRHRRRIVYSVARQPSVAVEVTRLRRRSPWRIVGRFSGVRRIGRICRTVRVNHGRFREKLPCFLVCREQPLNPCAQRRITGAGAIEKRGVFGAR